jgi:HK97 family phage prohead protease
MDEVRRELRSASVVDAELKGRTVKGYAAVYDTPWKDGLIESAGYVEEIARGAFRKALARAENIPLLWQHEPRDLLATTKAGTLRLKEDGRGLAFEADLPENTLGDYVLSMVESGDVGGMSYGMESTPSDSSIERRGGQIYRIVRNIRRIIDTTMTYEPSYEAATVELRSMGFAALPLQEFPGGNEAQFGEAVTANASVAMLEYRSRLRAIEISILEEG